MARVVIVFLSHLFLGVRLYCHLPLPLPRCALFLVGTSLPVLTWMCASTNSALVAQARMRQISRLSLQPWCSSSSSSPLHGCQTTYAIREHRGVTPTLAANRLMRLHVDTVLSMSRLPCALVPAMDAHARIAAPAFRPCALSQVTGIHRICRLLRLAGQRPCVAATAAQPPP